MGGIAESGEAEDNFTLMQMLALHKHASGFLVEWPDGQVCGHFEIQRFKGQKIRNPSLDMNKVRLDTMAFKAEDLKCRTLTEMLTGNLDINHERRERLHNGRGGKAQDSKSHLSDTAGEAHP